MKDKRIIIALICLIVFCVLLLFGASFIHYFIPQAMPIYTTMYFVGGIGTFVLGGVLGFSMTDLRED